MFAPYDFSFRPENFSDVFLYISEDVFSASQKSEYLFSKE